MFRALFNRVIDRLKWPVALAMLVVLPPALLSLVRLAVHIATHPRPWAPLWAGLAAFGLLWGLWLRRDTAANWLYTLEHELTHAMAAALTLNRITGLSAERGSGHLTYQGHGNWLISLAPYIVPTFCLPVLLVLQLATPSAQPWLMAALGLTLGLHLHGTWVETHAQQTDLQRHGRLASLCILPGAFALAMLAVLASVPGQQPVVAAAWTASVRQLRLLAASLPVP